MGLLCVGQTLAGSVERNQQMKALQSQASRVLNMKLCAMLSPTKPALIFLQTKPLMIFLLTITTKVGQLTANGTWKTNKTVNQRCPVVVNLVTLSAIAGKSNVATAKRVVKNSRYRL